MPTPTHQFSTVLEVRQTLVDRIAGYLETGGIEQCVVTFGHPGQDIPAKFVAVDTTEEGTTLTQRGLPATASRTQQETYDLRLIFWVQASGQHDVAAQVACTVEAWTMLRAVLAGLRASSEDITLGGLVTSAQCTRVVDDDYLLTEGRAAQLVATLHILANRI